jgi:hypothetical protein
VGIGKIGTVFQGDEIVVNGEQEAPVPQAGSMIRSPGAGCTQSTMAWMSGRGVKYWPAPSLTSWAPLQEAGVGLALPCSAPSRR